MPDLDKNSFEVATRFLLLVSLALLPLLYDYFHGFVLDIYIENCTIRVILYIEYCNIKVENYEIDIQSS